MRELVLTKSFQPYTYKSASESTTGPLGLFLLLGVLWSCSIVLFWECLMIVVFWLILTGY